MKGLGGKFKHHLYQSYYRLTVDTFKNGYNNYLNIKCINKIYPETKDFTTCEEYLEFFNITENFKWPNVNIVNISNFKYCECFYDILKIIFPNTTIINQIDSYDEDYQTKFDERQKIDLLVFSSTVSWEYIN